MKLRLAVESLELWKPEIWKENSESEYNAYCEAITYLTEKLSDPISKVTNQEAESSRPSSQKVEDEKKEETVLEKKIRELSEKCLKECAGSKIYHNTGFYRELALSVYVPLLVEAGINEFTGPQFGKWCNKVLNPFFTTVDLEPTSNGTLDGIKRTQYYWRGPSSRGLSSAAKGGQIYNPPGKNKTYIISDDFTADES